MLCALDLKLLGTAVRVTGIYMPYDCVHVEALYAQLERLATQAREKKVAVAVAGDFNADVEHKISIENRITEGNARGRWFKIWCMMNDFNTANLVTDADAEDAWTFRNGQLRKQLGYILLDKA